MPSTKISRVNSLGKGQPNELQFLYCKKCIIGDLKITGLDARETETPHIEFVEPDTDIDPILTGAKTKLQYMPTIKEELEQDMDVLPSIIGEVGTQEAAEQRIYPIVKREPQEIISLTNNATPEATPGVRILSRVIVQNKQYYIPSMFVNQYKTVNTQVEYGDNFHPDNHMMFCQEFIE